MPVSMRGPLYCIGQRSLTAMDAEGAKEDNSFNAEEAKGAKEYKIGVSTSAGPVTSHELPATEVGGARRRRQRSHQVMGFPLDPRHSTLHPHLLSPVTEAVFSPSKTPLQADMKRLP
jgi:hypothetical protein